MSRIGRAPIPIPDGVTVDITGQKVVVTGPRGELRHTVVEPIRINREDDGTLLVTRPTDRGPHRALHGLSRSLVANMVEGVSAGFERQLEIVGVGYRAQLKGEDPGDGRRLLAPCYHRAPRGDRVRRARCRLRWSCAGSTSRRSGRSPPRSAPCARPSPTRARASGTRARQFVVRSVREHEHHDTRSAPPAPPQDPWERRRLRRASAPRRLPLEQADLRPDHRRRPRAHACGRRIARGRAARPGEGRGRREGRASCSPSGRSRPASSGSSSIAAATSTTGASSRSPTGPARAGSSSSSSQRVSARG